MLYTKTGYNHLQYYQRVADCCSKLECPISHPAHQVTPTSMLVEEESAASPLFASPTVTKG